VRRLGHGVEDAQDLTQEFFGRLIEKNYIQTADARKGTFRSFLLTALKRFLANEWDRANRQKRGGGREMISLDDQHAESRHLAESSDAMTPEKAFDRRWAITLLGQVLNRLQAEFAGAGKGKVFEELKVFLTGEKSPSPYAQIAGRLEMAEGTLKVTVHRLKATLRRIAAPGDRKHRRQPGGNRRRNPTLIRRAELIDAQPIGNLSAVSLK
jgi:RNA polymerase sigma factor (sigma-70 family)